MAQQKSVQRSERQSDQQIERGPRGELLSVLLDKIDADRYPSSTMMDLVEEILQPEDVQAYADVLMAKIREDQFPSMALM
ncbi:MAG: hypothetical protein ACRDTJ_27450, partial [Pseudonocardiaceae bacterium]